MKKLMSVILNKENATWAMQILSLLGLIIAHDTQATVVFGSVFIGYCVKELGLKK